MFVIEFYKEREQDGGKKFYILEKFERAIDLVRFLWILDVELRKYRLDWLLQNIAIYIENNNYKFYGYRIVQEG